MVLRFVSDGRSEGWLVASLLALLIGWLFGSSNLQAKCINHQSFNQFHPPAVQHQQHQASAWLRRLATERRLSRILCVYAMLGVLEIFDGRNEKLQLLFALKKLPLLRRLRTAHVSIRFFLSMTHS